MKSKMKTAMNALNEKITHLYCRAQCALSCRVNSICENRDGAEMILILGGCILAAAAVVIAVKVLNSKGETMANSMLDKAQQKMEGALN